MAWLYVAIIVVSTVLSDLLQSWEMKRHGEVTDFGVSGIGRLLKEEKIADHRPKSPAAAPVALSS